MSIPVNPQPDEPKNYYIICDNKMYRMLCSATEILYLAASEDALGETKLFINTIHSYSEPVSDGSSDEVHEEARRPLRRHKTAMKSLSTPGHTLYGVFHNNAHGSFLTRIAQSTVRLRAWCGEVR
jgi:hypothetical protein